MSLFNVSNIAKMIIGGVVFISMSLGMVGQSSAAVRSDVFGGAFAKPGYASKVKKRSYRRRSRKTRRYRKRNRGRVGYRRKGRKGKRSYLRRKTRYNRGFSVRGAHMKVVRRGIRTSCFPRRLRNLIAKVHKRFGRKIVVTSGYRSPKHNRRIGGARRSQHMSCTAVDFKVPGVSKSALARYVKSLPGRGGVGTYCRNSSIHLDVGPRRSWHWGCGKRRKVRTARRFRLKRSRRR